MGSRRRSLRDPTVLSGVLLHPGALASLVLLLLNDHHLKAAFPGTITGKVSDLAGLVFFPLLLVTALELARWCSKSRGGYTTRELRCSLLVAGGGFALVKSSTAIAGWYSWTLGVLRWPFRTSVALASGSELPDVAPVVVLADRTDLIALPALLLAWRIGATYSIGPSDRAAATARAPEDDHRGRRL